MLQAEQCNSGCRVEGDAGDENVHAGDEKIHWKCVL